jgi:hypothetical protein
MPRKSLRQRKGGRLPRHPRVKKLHVDEADAAAVGAGAEDVDASRL